MKMNVDSDGLKEQIKNILPESINNDDVIFVCIGTDRSTGDSLAPIVGTYLTERGYKNVYGTLNSPVHAVNLVDIIKTLPNDKVVIAIDACLGRLSSVGLYQVRKGSIKAGAGVGKELPEVGDYSIVGIVNVGGFMEYFVLQNTRLNLVMNMAKDITDGIVDRFPLIEVTEDNDISLRVKIANYIGNLRKSYKRLYT